MTGRRRRICRSESRRPLEIGSPLTGLLRGAKYQRLALTGPGGLLKSLTKTVLETALEEELSEHLGYDEHDPVGRNRGNSRNGYRSKTVVTDNCGQVQIAVPRGS